MGLFIKRLELIRHDLIAWTVAGTFFIVSVIAFFYSDMVFEPGGIEGMIFGLSTGAISSLLLLALRPQMRAARLFSSILHYCVSGSAIVMLSLSVSRFAMPLADGEMLSFDRSIGFHWRSFNAFVVQNPVIETILHGAYSTLLWQPVLLILIFSLKKDQREVSAFVLANTLIFIFTTAIFACVPVTTAWHHMNLSIAEVEARHMQDTRIWVESLMALRTGAPLMISNHMGFAIIGFPSYHTAGAVLCAGAFASIPRLRYLGLLLNVTIIVATPIMGGHYIADILSGAAVGLAGIWLSNVMMGYRPRHQSKIPWRFIPQLQPA